MGKRGFPKKRNKRLIKEIKVFLVLKEMTATDLAEKTGITRQYVNQLLRGDSYISYDKTQKIAQALNLTDKQTEQLLNIHEKYTIIVAE